MNLFLVLSRIVTLGRMEIEEMKDWKERAFGRLGKVFVYTCAALIVFACAVWIGDRRYAYGGIVPLVFVIVGLMIERRGRNRFVIGITRTIFLLCGTFVVSCLVYICIRPKPPPFNFAAICGHRLYFGMRGVDKSDYSLGNDYSLFPCAPVSDGANPSGQERVFADSVEYFNWLFDMANYGKTNWAPRVKDVSPDTVTWRQNTTEFTAENVQWSVAEGVDENAPDVVPFLVSANLDCSTLWSSFDGQDPSKIRLHDWKVSVFVRKRGITEIQESKYMKSYLVYMRTPFTNGPRSYLTPTGRVWTR